MPASKRVNAARLKHKFMKISYDSEIDALYIRLSKVSKSAAPCG